MRIKLIVKTVKTCQKSLCSLKIILFKTFTDIAPQLKDLHENFTHSYF